MMFSERLGHGKYDFEYLQGTMRAHKPAQFRGFSEDHFVWDPKGALIYFEKIPKNVRGKLFDFLIAEKNSGVEKKNWAQLRCRII